MKVLPFLVLTCLLFSGCAGTTQSLRDTVPLLNSYMKGKASAGNPVPSKEEAAPKVPQISPSKAALMETAQLDQL